MFRLKIITVGKMKKKCWVEAIAHYDKMLTPVVRVEAVHVKDCPQALGLERKRQESQQILNKIGPKDHVIALHETGTLMNSVDFAAFLRARLEDPLGECCFIVGGALGLSPELLDRARTRLSLSLLTMPHELALVVLYEQIFRATTIMAGRTYHY